MVARGIITGVDDGTSLQTVQAEFGALGLRDRLTRLQSYGLTSVPLIGAAALAAGVRDSAVVIHVDDPRHRPAGLGSGEVCLYSHDGSRLHFLAGKKARLAADSVHIAAKKLKLGETIDLVALVHDLIDALTRATAGGDNLICPELPLLKVKISELMGARDA